MPEEGKRKHRRTRSWLAGLIRNDQRSPKPVSDKNNNNSNDSPTNPAKKLTRKGVNGPPPAVEMPASPPKRPTPPTPHVDRDIVAAKMALAEQAIQQAKANKLDELLSLKDVWTAFMLEVEEDEASEHEGAEDSMPLQDAWRKRLDRDLPAVPDPFPTKKRPPPLKVGEHERSASESSTVLKHSPSLVSLSAFPTPPLPSAARPASPPLVGGFIAAGPNRTTTNLPRLMVGSTATTSDDNETLNIPGTNESSYFSPVTPGSAGVSRSSSWTSDKQLPTEPLTLTKQSLQGLGFWTTTTSPANDARSATDASASPFSAQYSWGRTSDTDQSSIFPGTSSAPNSAAIQQGKWTESSWPPSPIKELQNELESMRADLDDEDAGIGIAL